MKRLIHIFLLLSFLNFSVEGSLSVVSESSARNIDSKLSAMAHTADVHLFLARLHPLIIKLRTLKLHISLLEKQPVRPHHFQTIRHNKEELETMNASFVDVKKWAAEKKIIHDPRVEKALKNFEKQIAMFTTRLSKLKRKVMTEKLVSQVKPGKRKVRASKLRSTFIRKQKMAQEVKRRIEKLESAHRTALHAEHIKTILDEIRVRQNEIRDLDKTLKRGVKAETRKERHLMLVGIEQHLVLLQKHVIHVEVLAHRYKSDRDPLIVRGLSELKKSMQNMRNKYHKAVARFKKMQVIVPAKPITPRFKKDVQSETKLVAEVFPEKVSQLEKKKKVHIIVSNANKILDDVEVVKRRLVKSKKKSGRAREIALASIAPKIEAMKLHLVAFDDVLKSEGLSHDQIILQSISPLKKQVADIEAEYAQLKTIQQVEVVTQVPQMKLVDEAKQPVEEKAPVKGPVRRTSKKTVSSQLPSVLAPTTCKGSSKDYAWKSAVDPTAQYKGKTVPKIKLGTYTTTNIWGVSTKHSEYGQRICYGHGTCPPTGFATAAGTPHPSNWKCGKGKHCCMLWFNKGAWWRSVASDCCSDGQVCILGLCWPKYVQYLCNSKQDCANNAEAKKLGLTSCSMRIQELKDKYNENKNRVKNVSQIKSAVSKMNTYFSKYKGYCTQPVGKGGECFSTDGCADGLVCYSPTGDKCTSDKLCDQGICTSVGGYLQDCRENKPFCNEGLSCISVRDEKCEGEDPGMGGRTIEKCTPARSICVKNKAAATQDC